MKFVSSAHDQTLRDRPAISSSFRLLRREYIPVDVWIGTLVSFYPVDTQTGGVYSGTLSGVGVSVDVHT